MDEEGLRSADMAFSTPSAAGHDVSLSSKHTKITTDNRAEYIRLALNYRFASKFMLCSGFGKCNFKEFLGSNHTCNLLNYYNCVK